MIFDRRYQYYDNRVDSRGGNGYVNTYGIRVDTLWQGIYTLFPLRKNDDIAMKCWISVPKADFWALVKELESKGERPNE